MSGLEIGGWFEVEFALVGGDGPNVGITGTGDQFKIFATVMDVLRDFIKSQAPDRVTFEAKEKSRFDLYKALIRRFASRMGYKLEKVDKGITGKEFSLVRK
jgi:hypothetical protein